jgi:hypothetical protein
MPFKNPEDKRQWEREHREQRNAQRRANRTSTLTLPTVPKSVLDTVLVGKRKSGWEMILALVFGFGVALLGALSGVRLSKVRCFVVTVLRCQAGAQPIHQQAVAAMITKSFQFSTAHPSSGLA